MKRFLGGLVLGEAVQASLLGHWLRPVVRATHPLMGYSLRFRLATQAVERPHYAYCMIRGAELARRLGHSHISAIEFGVAGGNGLRVMCDLAAEIEREIGVRYTCWGFDTGKGMPPPQGPRDLPYWFQEAQYVMDEPALRARVPEARLVLGDIAETVGDFVARERPAPIAAIFNDTDYFSSTMESFRLFDAVPAHPEAFLPRIFCYFDDVIGSDYEMYCSVNGQLAAIEEFNARKGPVQIALNQNLMNRPSLRYAMHIYYAHLFDHPDYATYVGAERQKHLQDALKLR